MLTIAQALTLLLFFSWIMEKDTGRAISKHMVFNERLSLGAVWSWCIVGIIALFV
jgi:hypothetical protein